MSDISIHSNSSNVLQEIQTLLERIEAPEIDSTGQQSEAKGPLTFVEGAPTTPNGPLPAQPEIESPAPGADPEGGLDKVPAAVDKFVKGGGKPLVLGGGNPGSGKPGNQPPPASRMADTMFTLLDVILLIQKAAQERRKTGLEAQHASRNLKMQHLTAEADAIGKAGAISAKYAYIGAGLQAGTTVLSAGLTVKGVKEQVKAFSESGLSAARANMTAATKDQKLLMESVSAKPGGPVELNNMNNGKIEIPKGMGNTEAYLKNGVPHSKAQGEYGAAKLQVADAQKQVNGALKNVNTKTQELAKAKAGTDQDVIKKAEKNLADAKKDLGLAKDNLAEMKQNCEMKASAYTEECVAFKKAMDADIKTAETNLKAGKVSPGDVENMKAFRETECKNMISSKDLQKAFNERIDSCQNQLDIASNRFVNGAGANEAKNWEAFAQLAKAVGDNLASFFNAAGGAKDAEAKQESKIAASKAEQDQNDADDAAAKAKQALDQLNQANELLKFLAETSRATTNRILGA